MDWSKLNNLVQRQVKHSPWIDFDVDAQRWSMIINVAHGQLEAEYLKILMRLYLNELTLSLH